MTRILVVSDLHVGSRYGLMPKQWGDVLANPIQREILKKWDEMCKREREIDYLIVNGDAVDGTSPAEEGKYQSISDTDEQVNAAAELVSNINCDKILVTYGSKYHTKENPNLDEAFAKEVGASKHDYEISFQPKTLDDVFHLAHNIGISFSSWVYRTTPIAKELVAALLNEKELHSYKCVIRSHAHYYCMVSFTSNFGLITPCWQTRTPYMVKKGLSMIPKLGYVLLEKRDRNSGWIVTPRTFNMPRPELVKL